MPHMTGSLGSPQISGSLRHLGPCGMVGSLASPDALVLGLSMGQQYPSCQGPQPSWTLGSLPVGHSGGAGGADPTVAALTAVG